jgi:cellulose synthase/poly-beta-1,6-N-acetylglucosamine synthase-like glycosyltransferase
MVQLILESLVSALVALVAAIFVYQAVRAVWGLRVPAMGGGSDRVRFGVLVPAHNEEATIDALIASLRQVNYPASMLRVLFVADHCDDGTVARIRAAGYDCLDRQQGPRGKTASLADGLAWLTQRYGTECEAIAFFDADNVVDPGFFRHAAAGLEAGHPVVQGRVGVQNWNATLFARLNYMNAVVENRMEELARSQAGLTCNLRGHGMVFRREVLDRVPWEAGTLVEDQEMLVRLVLAGYRVFWAEHARVNSVLPENTKEAATQRRRWAGGRSAILKSAVRALAVKWRSDGDRVAFHLMIDFLLPSHAVQLSLAFLAVLMSAVVAGLYSWQLAAALALVCLYFAYFLAGNRLSGVPMRTFLSVLWAPGYIFWRTWIYLTSLKGALRWR